MSQLDYRALRGQISIRRVLELVGYQATVRRGLQWRGPCPFCDDRHTSRHPRCFSVHVGRNLFHCFRCGRSGNQLDLWVHLRGLPLYPATLDLCHQLAIEPIPLPNPQPPTHH